MVRLVTWCKIGIPTDIPSHHVRLKTTWILGVKQTAALNCVHPSSHSTSLRLGFVHNRRRQFSELAYCAHSEVHTQLLTF
jgi:hypothetical protein